MNQTLHHLPTGSRSRPRKGRLPRRVRNLVLTAHVAVSVGWLGLDAALIVLAVTGSSTDDAALLAASYQAMGLLGGVLLVPVAAATLATGLVLALGTNWGLVRYYWVLVKFAITVALTGAGIAVLLPRLQQVAAGATGAVRTQVLVGPSVALVLLVAATALSVVKPWGSRRAGHARLTDRARAHLRVPRGR